MCLRDRCVPVCVYMYDICTAVVPKLSSSGACLVINSTSAREQINGGCTVMEYRVKGEAERMGGEIESKDKKDVNIGQRRGKRGGKCEKKNKRIKNINFIKKKMQKIVGY